VTIFERPPVRSARWWAFDVLVALFAAGAAIPNMVQAHVSSGFLGAILVVALAAPLLVRRIWPVEVFGWIFVVTAIGVAWNAEAANGLSILIALYTVAAGCPRRPAIISAAVLELGVIAGAIRVKGFDWWYAAIFLSGLVAAALALGLYIATRRAYLLELHDRAERLERERDQANELAAITERARIVREMHDIVAHHLTVMVSLSDGAAATSVKSPQRAAEVMRTVSATGRQALADTRRLLGVLSEDAGPERRPVPDLDGLDDLVAGVRAAGLPVSYEIQGEAGPLPSGAQLTVYRLVQEALTNTLKHGGAGTRATVRLRYLPGELQVDIEDDGAGTGAPAPAGTGRGLAGMRERVHAYGGQVQTGPRSPAGWRVSARLHLDETTTT
jgi:signal transduction histidine kinase